MADGGELHVYTERIYFTPEFGIVRYRPARAYRPASLMSTLPDRAPVVRIRADAVSAEAGQGLHHIRVEDEGIGFEPQYAEQFFVRCIDAFRPLLFFAKAPSTALAPSRMS